MKNTINTFNKKNIDLAINNKIKYNSIDFINYLGVELSQEKENIFNIMNSTDSKEIKVNKIYVIFELMTLWIQNDITITGTQKQDKIERLLNISTVLLLVIYYGENSNEVNEYIEKNNLRPSTKKLYSKSIIEAQISEWIANVIESEQTTEDNDSIDNIELVEYWNTELEKINDDFIFNNEIMQSKLLELNERIFLLEEWKQKGKRNRQNEKHIKELKEDIKKFILDCGVIVK